MQMQARGRGQPTKQAEIPLQQCVFTGRGQPNIPEKDGVRDQKNLTLTNFSLINFKLVFHVVFLYHIYMHNPNYT